MGGYSKTLVAYDDSPSSRNALRQAVEKFPEGWLKVLAVVPVYEGDLALVGVRDMHDLRRGPRAHLLEAARELTRSDAGRVEIEVRQGDAFEEIVRTARDENCRMIVMGRHGARQLDRMLMGSVTAKVIVHSASDVVVIPRDRGIVWDNILVATDGSKCGRHALRKALDFARLRAGAVTVVSVVDMFPEYYADAPEVVDKMEVKVQASLAAAEEIAGAADAVIGTQLLHGDPGEEITSFARRSGAGIIFVGTRGRSRLGNIFLGSVAQKVIGLAPCPVFVSKSG